MLRWRGAVIWSLVRKSPNRRSSPARISAGDNTAMRAAASSIASGMPSRWPQMSATICMSSAENTKSGDRAWSRSTKLHGCVPGGERGDRPQLLSPQCKRDAVGGQHADARAVCQHAVDETSGCSEDMFAVVEEQERPSPSQRGDDVDVVALAGWLADRARHGGGHPPPRASCPWQTPGPEPVLTTGRSAGTVRHLVVVAGRVGVLA
jgi:hypothetical protein